MDDRIAYTIEEAAKVTGLGRTSLYLLIGAGKIAARKCGHRTLVPAEALRAYIDSLPSATIRTGQTHNAA